MISGWLALAPAISGAETIEQLVQRDVLELRLGEPVSAQPAPFREFACGTNGGPPAQPLSGFGDFAQCPVEASSGLHEVAFRYDDELEYYALAMNLAPVANRYGGTRFGSFPVIVSALIDDDAVLRGYRVVTDDRVPLRERRAAYTMNILVKSRLGGEWSCTQRDLDAGETAVGRNFLKEDCVGVSPDGARLALQARFLHRKGQSQIDPHSGKVREGLFESTARLEVTDADWNKP